MKTSTITSLAAKGTRLTIRSVHWAEDFYNGLLLKPEQVHGLTERPDRRHTQFYLSQLRHQHEGEYFRHDVVETRF